MRKTKMGKPRIKTVEHGCPYCGSEKGFEQKIALYQYYNADGESDGYDEGESVWKYPRCMECGKSVQIEE